LAGGSQHSTGRAEKGGKRETAGGKCRESLLVLAIAPRRRASPAACLLWGRWRRNSSSESGRSRRGPPRGDSGGKGGTGMEYELVVGPDRAANGGGTHQGCRDAYEIVRVRSDRIIGG
jgi:hypothetical protein